MGGVSLHQVDQPYLRPNDQGSRCFAENWATPTICFYQRPMTRILLPLASILALGCTEAAVQQIPVVPRAPPVVVVYGGQNAYYGANVANPQSPRRNYRQRDVGDFIVYRFTGKIQKAPTTLTKRIIGRADDVLEVDMIVEHGRKKEKFRVRISDAPTNRDTILSAARIESDRLVLISVDKFRQQMAKTIVLADENEGLLQSEPVTATVGQEALAASRNTYRVRLGKKHAILRATSSADFCWGDIEGEIVSAKGDVLYRSEIIHVGHRNIKTVERAPQVAQSQFDFE